jgi:hypothetical protein
MRPQKCPCGSPEFPEARHDGYGIFLCYTCSRCEKQRLAEFRPDIFTAYDCDETIDSDY